MPEPRGRFITLEGGEGTGKSTHAARLAAWLHGRGVAVRQTREPGGTPRAEAIRDLLLAGRAAPFGAEAEAILFAVARVDHMSETIRPALERGEWVVCDRFMDSSRAYQGTDGVPEEVLDRLEGLAVGGDRPDLTIVLDVPAKVGLARAEQRGGTPDRFGRGDLATHERRRAAFLAIAARAPERCVVIDATRNADEVASSVAGAVAERLGAFLPSATGE